MDPQYSYRMTLYFGRNASEIPPDRCSVIENDGFRFRFVMDCWFLAERGNSLRLDEDICSLPRRLLNEAGDDLLIDHMREIGDFVRNIWKEAGPDDPLSRITRIMFRVNLDFLLIGPRARATIPADEPAIDALERVKVCDEGCCPICLEEMTPESEQRMMPCKHVYHEECIVTWLKKCRLCPLCRFPLPTGTSKAA
ncbi:hypothetical protein MLD38_001874 [Melastoma candidum]|uniref:Uncharacterized protein n=1 Tax=Melastoma candidum TaxID=119954 RepID=A0ACB9SJJ3_9MYRT|nr:hypothetical protein MLD38_001874 [Melastoma candidum]